MTSSDAGGDGFGFATTIDMARSVADELIRTGKVVHAWLGIEGGDLDATTALALTLEGGARAAGVDHPTPATRRDSGTPAGTAT